MDFVGGYKKIKSALVAIGARSQGDPKDPPFIIFGTGVCIHPSGIVVTCYHVFREYQERMGLNDFAQRFETVFEALEAAGDREPYDEVELLDIYAIFFREFRDERTTRWQASPTRVQAGSVNKRLDVAILRLKDPYFRDAPAHFPSVTLGDSDSIQEGEVVAAAGFPFGHELHAMTGGVNSTISMGLVSAILPAPPAIRARDFVEFQLDMTIEGGNSGGPVFRLNGDVIGLVTSVVEHEETKISRGIAFAVPINAVAYGLGRLIEREHTSSPPKDSPLRVEDGGS